MRNKLILGAACLMLAIPAIPVTPAHAQGFSTTGALAGGLVGALTAPSKNKEGHALIGAAAGGLLGGAYQNRCNRCGRTQTQYAPVQQQPQYYYAPPPGYKLVPMNGNSQ